MCYCFEIIKNKCSQSQHFPNSEYNIRIAHISLIHMKKIKLFMNKIIVGSDPHLREHDIRNTILETRYFIYVLQFFSHGNG